MIRRWLLLPAILAITVAFLALVFQPLAQAAGPAPTPRPAEKLYRPGRIEPVITPKAAPAGPDPAAAPAPDQPDQDPTAHDFLLPHGGAGRVIMTATAGDVMIAFMLLLLFTSQTAGLIFGGADD